MKNQECAFLSKLPLSVPEGNIKEQILEINKYQSRRGCARRHRRSTPGDHHRRRDKPWASIGTPTRRALTSRSPRSPRERRTSAAPLRRTASRGSRNEAASLRKRAEEPSCTKQTPWERTLEDCCRGQNGGASWCGCRLATRTVSLRMAWRHQTGR